MPSPFDPEGWRGDPDGTITNVTLENPSGSSVIGLAEQTGAGPFTFLSSLDNPQDYQAGDKLYAAFIYKRVGLWEAGCFISFNKTGVQLASARIDIRNNTYPNGNVDEVKFTDLGNDFVLVEAMQSLDADISGCFALATFTDMVNAPTQPPIGSQLYVQAAYFGKNPLAFPYSIYNQFADAGEATDYSYFGYNETISGGLLNLVSTNNDPQMIKSVNFDPSDFYILKLRVRENIDLGGGSKSMTMFFRTDTQPYAVETHTNFSLEGTISSWATRVGPDAEGFYDFEIDMSQHPEWLLNGDIKGIRFDFTNAQIGTDTDVDYITLESPSKKAAYDAFWPANVMPTL